jgi:hypothetical protein
MDWREFQEWFDTHSAAFPGIGPWLARSSKGEMAPSQKSIIDSWFKALYDVPLDAAKRATGAMLNGDLPEPNGFERHVAAIRAFARKSQRRLGTPSDTDLWSHCRTHPELRNGEWRFTCIRCEDVGNVIIWSVDTLKQIIAHLRGSDKLIKWTTQAVCCDCEFGRRKSGGKLSVYNPKFHTIVPMSGDEESKQEAIEQAAHNLGVELQLVAASEQQQAIAPNECDVPF